MKRVILDVFFILLVVCLGSSLNSLNEQNFLENKIQSFEEQIANHEVIEQQHSVRVTYQTKENFAGQLGVDLSDFVTQTVGNSVQFIGDVMREFRN